MASSSHRLRPGIALAALMLCIAIASAVSYTSHGAVHRLTNPPRDLLIDGKAAPGLANLEAWLAKRDARCCRGDVMLFTEGDHIPIAAGDLGFSIDVDATLRRAKLAEPKDSWFRRLKRGFFPTPLWTEIHAAYSFDPNAARIRLQQLAPSLYRAPKNAILDVRAHRRIDDVPGRKLDVHATLGRLDQLSDGETSVELAFESIPAAIKSTDLAPVDVSRVLARFETDFKKKAGRRAINIRRAAELLDGFVLAPGETFSFNRVVGNRTERNGFTWAPVIVNDEMEPGVGGGVCQVATTVHAAAVLGGLEVVRRRSHSRPSGYAPLGLDATVIYGEVDLRFKNPLPVPLMIHAFFPSEYLIRVELLGADPVGNIDHRYAVTERHDFYRRVVENADLAAGEFKRTQQGGFGYDIISFVDTTLKDGSQMTHRYSSKYYPVPEVYKIGPGTSPDELPELPEGASHVEVASIAGEESFDDVTLSN